MKNRCTMYTILLILSSTVLFVFLLIEVNNTTINLSLYQDQSHAYRMVIKMISIGCGVYSIISFVLVCIRLTSKGTS